MHLTIGTVPTFTRRFPFLFVRALRCSLPAGRKTTPAWRSPLSVQHQRISTYSCVWENFADCCAREREREGNIENRFICHVVLIIGRSSARCAAQRRLLICGLCVYKWARTTSGRTINHRTGPPRDHCRSKGPSSHATRWHIGAWGVLFFFCKSRLYICCFLFSVKARCHNRAHTWQKWWCHITVRVLSRKYSLSDKKVPWSLKKMQYSTLCVL